MDDAVRPAGRDAALRRRPTYNALPGRSRAARRGLVRRCRRCRLSSYPGRQPALSSGRGSCPSSLSGCREAVTPTWLQITYRSRNSFTSSINGCNLSRGKSAESGHGDDPCSGPGDRSGCDDRSARRRPVRPQAATVRRLRGANSRTAAASLETKGCPCERPKSREETPVKGTIRLRPREQRGRVRSHINRCDPSTTIETPCSAVAETLSPNCY